MGWSGGTEIFDTAVDLFFENTDSPSEAQVDNFVLGLYDSFTDSDWDTVDESHYFDLIENALNKNGMTLYGE